MHEKSKSFYRQICENVESLRRDQRAGSPRIFHSTDEVRRHEGLFFVESVGTMVFSSGGQTDFFYESQGLQLRDHDIATYASGREKLFRALAAQLDPGKSLLVIGAGGDTAPVQAFRDAGLDVLATDFSQDTVDALRSRVEVSAFGCDLIDLPRVLPGPIEYFFGNSTLAYLDPAKSVSIIDSIAPLIGTGGLFTFDMSPHPRYFLVAEGARSTRVVNPSALAPVDALPYIERFGLAPGCTAFALHNNLRHAAVNAATVAVISDLFRERGFTCRTGQVMVERPGGHSNVLVLRVARDSNAKLLEPLRTEETYSEPSVVIKGAMGLPKLSKFYIDRAAGLVLAPAFDVESNERKSAWGVADFFAAHDPRKSELDLVRDSVLDAIAIDTLRENISACLNGEQKIEAGRLSKPVYTDQVIRNGAMTGSMNCSRDEADMQIDRVYAVAREHELQEQAREREQASRKKSRDKSKQQRKARKKGRKR